MTPEKLRYFAKRLKQEEHRLKTQLVNLERRTVENAQGQMTSELSSYDNHPADLGSETFERGKDIALCDNIKVLLENVKRAQEAIEAGRYGMCVRCRKEIPEERLEAIPWANECVHCQTIKDKTDVARRPIEERVISPPFVRTFLDNVSVYNGFDGEDALQAVERYGTSDTPQDLPGMHDYKTFGQDEHAGIVDPADAIPDE